MRDFPAPRPDDRLGTLINLVRAKVRTIQVGQPVEAVLATLGPPDSVENGLAGWLPAETEKQINELGSRFIQVSRPIAEGTFIYVNPYRERMTHRITIALGKVTRVWEVQSAARPAV